MKEDKRGHGYERGFTRLYILKLLLNEVRGLKDSELRNRLKKELDISERKGFYEHLKKIRKDGLISRTGRKGLERGLELKKNIQTLKILAERFHDSDYATDFIKSRFTQVMIKQEVRGFLNRLKLFSEDQMKEILTMVKMSPSALHLLLNGDLFKREWGESDAEIRERVISAFQVALAYDGEKGRAVSEEFNRMHFDIKTTLKHPEPHPRPVTLSEAHVEYLIFERKEMIEKKKLELKKQKGGIERK